MLCFTSINLSLIHLHLALYAQWFLKHSDGTAGKELGAERATPLLDNLAARWGLDIATPFMRWAALNMPGLEYKQKAEAMCGIVRHSVSDALRVILPNSVAVCIRALQGYGTFMITRCITHPPDSE